MKFDDLVDHLAVKVYLYRHLKNRVDNVGYHAFQGVLPDGLDFNEVVQKLTEYDALLEENELKRSVSVSIGASEALFFAWTLKDLVSRFQYKVPDAFYIADMDYYTADRGPESDDIRKYRCAQKLLAIVCSDKVADYEVSLNGQKKLIFIGKSKFLMPIEYNLDHLQGANFDGLERFEIDFVNSDIHSDQKRMIIKAVILEMHKEGKVAVFGQLVQHFVDFAKRVRDSYELYVSEFSFQKIKAEIERDKLDFITKESLNKPFHFS